MKLENAEVTKANDKVTDPPDTNIVPSIVTLV
jgi:hypothetical protein